MDDRVSIRSSIGEYTRPKVDHHNRHVSYQNGHVLVICHRADCQTEKATAATCQCQCATIGHNISEGVIFECIAIVTTEADDQRINPHEGQPHQCMTGPVGMHRVHSIRVLPFEHGVVVGDLKHVAETQVDELIGCYQESKAEHVSQSFNRVFPLPRYEYVNWFLSQLPEDARVQESCQKTDEDQVGDAYRITEAVKHLPTVQKGGLLEIAYFSRLANC